MLKWILRLYLLVLCAYDASQVVRLLYLQDELAAVAPTLFSTALRGGVSTPANAAIHTSEGRSTNVMKASYVGDLAQLYSTVLIVFIFARVVLVLQMHSAPMRRLTMLLHGLQIPLVLSMLKRKVMEPNSGNEDLGRYITVGITILTPMLLMVLPPFAPPPVAAASAKAMMTTSGASSGAHHNHSHGPDGTCGAHTKKTQ